MMIVRCYKYCTNAVFENFPRLHLIRFEVSMPFSAFCISMHERLPEAWGCCMFDATSYARSLQVAAVTGADAW